MVGYGENIGFYCGVYVQFCVGVVYQVVEFGVVQVVVGIGFDVLFGDEVVEIDIDYCVFVLLVVQFQVVEIGIVDWYQDVCLVFGDC